MENSESKRKPVSKEKQRQYNKSFYETHKDKPNEDCKICFGTYNIFNKSHHMKTTKHKKAIQMRADETK